MAKKIAAARSGFSCTAVSSAVLCDLTNSRVRYCFTSKMKNAAMATTMASRTTSFPLLMDPPGESGSVGAARRSLHGRGAWAGRLELEARPIDDAAEIGCVRARALGPGREEPAAPARIVVAE